MGKSTLDVIFEQVRSGMHRLRPGVPGRADPWEDVAATDDPVVAEVSGIDPEAAAELQRAWTASAHHGVTLSVILFGSERGARPEADTVCRIIETSLRRPQDGCRALEDDRYLLVLDDYPLMLARHTANRIITTAEESDIRLWAGITTINAVGDVREDCIRQAGTALAGALDQPDRRIVWVDMRPLQKRQRLAN